MKLIINISFVILLMLYSLEGQAQNIPGYWIRADISMVDADDAVNGSLELAIRVNGEDVISLKSVQDGVFGNGPRAFLNRAYLGDYPSEVVFFDAAPDVAITPDPLTPSLCYNGVVGGSTNPIPAPNSGDAFFGPSNGGGNIGDSTYFGCDDILGPGAQFFQLFPFRDLPEFEGGSKCIEESIVLSPGNDLLGIRRVLYSTSTMNTLQTLVSFDNPVTNPVSSYELILNTVPNIANATNVRFQIDYGNDMFTSIRTLGLTNCSPEIIENGITVINPNCSYDEGGFTVTFDRPLIDGEMLTSIGVYKDNNRDGVVNPIGSIDPFDQPTPNFATYDGTTFTYPESLAPGDYFFSYQTDNNNTEEISELFTITAPPPLQYTVEITNDISCFDTQDGEVTITINPNTNGSIGTPPYFYTINNGALIPFGNMNTSTVVSGLGTDALEIKVFDSKGCTERL